MHGDVKECAVNDDKEVRGKENQQWRKRRSRETGDISGIQIGKKTQKKQQTYFLLESE